MNSAAEPFILKGGKRGKNAGNESWLLVGLLVGLSPDFTLQPCSSAYALYFPFFKFINEEVGTEE